MSIDLRVKHDLESSRRAVELFDAGVGCKPAAEALSVPRETVREWQWVYRAFGSEALLSMDGKQSSYTFEQRVAAASAVVDGGMAKADAWIGNTYLDDSGRDSPASLNSTGDM